MGQLGNDGGQIAANWLYAVVAIAVAAAVVSDVVGQSACHIEGQACRKCSCVNGAVNKVWV
jgi:hypothetical protein